MQTKLIDAFIEEYNQYRQEFTKKAQAKLKEILSDFWNKNPAINVIVWTQYAPYFNDGDACVFSVNDPTFSNCTNSEEFSTLSWGEYDGDDKNVWAFGAWNVEKESNKNIGIDVEFVKDLCRFIQSDAMEDVLRITLGEDNLIIVTREGITCQDYSDQHD
jgi:hypothetical protein